MTRLQKTHFPEKQIEKIDKVRYCQESSLLVSCSSKCRFCKWLSSSWYESPTKRKCHLVNSIAHKVDIRAGVVQREIEVYDCWCEKGCPFRTDYRLKMEYLILGNQYSVRRCLRVVSSVSLSQSALRAISQGLKGVKMEVTKNNVEVGATKARRPSYTLILSENQIKAFASGRGLGLWNLLKGDSTFPIQEKSDCTFDGRRFLLVHASPSDVDRVKYWVSVILAVAGVKEPTSWKVEITGSAPVDVQGAVSALFA